MKIAKLGGILLIVSAIAAGIMAFANDKTAILIEQVNETANNESRKAVFPDADEYLEIDAAKLAEIQKEKPEVVEVFESKKSGELVGYIIKTAPSGYAGAVEVITGIDMEKKISGVRIGNHEETPGLGALAAEEDFYGQFGGKGIDKPLEVVKADPADGQVLAITGATITSDAVTSGVNISIEVLEMIEK